MKYTDKITIRIAVLIGLPLLLLGLICSCSSLQQSTAKQQEKTKVAVVTGGHDFEEEPFFAIFESCSNIEYTNIHLQNDSEIFEDISNWDYNVIVLYNMTQEISPQRQDNFVKLLNQGVGLVAMHHSNGAFQKWPEYRKIIGTRYYLEKMEEYGVVCEQSNFNEGLDLAIQVEDQDHPITKGISDFSIHDEAYKNCFFEKDNHILLTTEHPDSDRPVCWVREYDGARVCYIQLGHGPEAYANDNYRLLVTRAVSWSAGKLN
ncbi:MAG: ThuA domain-containing protein [Planctomycetota bacterium]|jgi:type 1 glutamine amidotransferase